ncbi:hypothetical protein [Radicibacter daui]|uniref:hypothetical protein n=1 Tax=Radicibacter daui TaxID=3064829 RepID=UPI004046D526
MNAAIFVPLAPGAKTLKKPRAGMPESGRMALGAQAVACFKGGDFKIREVLFLKSATLSRNFKIF